MMGGRTARFGGIFLLTLHFVRPVAPGGQSPVSQTVPPTASRTVRVHHLHFLAGDPIAAMQARADRWSGTLVPLPGLGPAVRIGTQYLLFASQQNASATPAGIERTQALFTESVRWLSDRGIRVAAPEFAQLPPALVSEELPLDHVAFASDSFASTVDDLVARGATLSSRTSESAMFALPEGNRIEILKSGEAPDAYWCPMHPGVRSSAAGKCPLCSMDLVVIKPPRVGEYRMDVDVTPGAQRRGIGGLHIVLRDPDSGVPVSDLLTVHEKPLHLFMISRDLEYFAHLHPELAEDGGFALKHTAPPGPYVIIADFLPGNGTSQMLHRAIVAPGPGQPIGPRVVPPTAFDIPDAAQSARGQQTWGSVEKTVDGVRIRLDGADLVTGQIGLLRFHLFNANDGTPINDLEPYLGAPGHMLMTTWDLTNAVHGHPEETSTSTGVITFKPLLPSPGAAKLWLQFQRKGKVSTLSFTVDIADQ